MNTGHVKQDAPSSAKQLGGASSAPQHSAREFGGTQIGQGGTSSVPRQIGGEAMGGDAPSAPAGHRGGQPHQARQSYMPRYDLTDMTLTSASASGVMDAGGEFMEGWPSLTQEMPGHDAHEDLYDPEYQQWRAEQLRRFDEDYRRWRQERFSRFLEEFNQWRQRRGGPSNPSTPST